MSDIYRNSSGERRTNLEGRLQRLAVDGHGVASLAELRRAGLSDDDVAYRTRIGRFRVIHRGVYVIGPGAITREGVFLAAVRAIGAGAVLSHRSAAAHWEFLDAPPGAVDVTVARSVRKRAGIRLHEVRSLAREDHLRHRDIPVTTPARTLLDLAAGPLPDRALRRAVQEAFVARRIGAPQLAAHLQRWKGRRGVPRLASLLEPDLAPTDSTLEDELLALCRAHGLPAPQTQAPILGYRVDALFGDHRLVLEGDGLRVHETPIRRRADRDRQAALEAAGYHVIRVTWHQVTRHPAQTAQRLRHALGYDRSPATAPAATAPSRTTVHVPAAS